MNGVITRRADTGELCTCGRQAVEVFVFSDGRPDVGYCGVADGGGHITPCPFCNAPAAHGDEVCPHYRLRPNLTKVDPHV